MMPSESNYGVSKNGKPLSKADKIQLWQHFVSTGGADKERMITINTWLLGLSATLLVYVGTQIFGPGNGTLSVPYRVVAPILGMLGSLFSLYIVMEYSKHANWNWKRANEFANEPELKKLKEPPEGQNRIFYIFLVLGLLSLLLHGLILLLSFYSPLNLFLGTPTLAGC